MSTKKTFKIKLDAEFTIDFGDYGFNSDQENKIEHFKKVILKEYINEVGYEAFDIFELKKQPISLFETMAEMFCPKNDIVL